MKSEGFIHLSLLLGTYVTAPFLWITSLISSYLQVS